MKSYRRASIEFFALISTFALIAAIFASIPS
jgi:hypothetical protein